MAHRIHSSARRSSLPQLTFAANFYNNPFINKNLRRQSSVSIETEECLSTLLAKEGENLDLAENQLKQLGEIIIRPSKFQLILDVIELSPEDIKVRAFRKGFLVSAAHCEILENGQEYTTNHFYREYILPKTICPEKVLAWITTENLLFVEAPKKFPDVIITDMIVEDDHNISNDDDDEDDDHLIDQFDYEDEAIDVEVFRQV
uniref:Heat shock protein 67B1-like n=1 Tax=Dermatophagoides pteronyssinus TaxID=6956 RepID=A0A6P6Y7B6_DERPT|nr:heat shock protein 67B1-like [Dermatophagoides pteronyssinus]